MALVDLDPAAAPQDAETVLAATFAELPEAVGLLEGLSGGIQGNNCLGCVSFNQRLFALGY